jgi:gas vesicle protein
MRSPNDNGLSYLLIGLGFGLLAGLLWAPRRGEELRDELRRGAGSGLDYLTKQTQKTRSEADRWLTRVRERWNQFHKPNNGKGRFEESTES